MCEEDEDKRSLSERWADAVFERDNFELTSMVQDPTAPVSAVVIQLNEKNVICGDDAGGRTALETALPPDIDEEQISIYENAYQNDSYVIKISDSNQTVDLNEFIEHYKSLLP